MTKKANNASQSFEQQSQETIGLLVHSYNNYLSGMMGFTELALLECQQQVVKERLELAMDSGKEAVIFGKQLLSSISRLQVKMVSVNLAVLLKELTAQSKDLKLISSRAIDLTQLFIKTDKDWFLVCLNSLVEFCQDYAKDNNLIVELSDLKGTVEINFVVNFKLEQAQIENLFKPFYSSRTLLAKKDLGLATLKGFVNQMNGNVSWTNQKGFVISLAKAANNSQV